MLLIHLHPIRKCQPVLSILKWKVLNAETKAVIKESSWARYFWWVWVNHSSSFFEAPHPFHGVPALQCFTSWFPVRALSLYLLIWLTLFVWIVPSNPTHSPSPNFFSPTILEHLPDAFDDDTKSLQTIRISRPIEISLGKNTYSHYLLCNRCHFKYLAETWKSVSCKKQKKTLIVLGH
jgi:hypothetical protein